MRVVAADPSFLRQFPRPGSLRDGGRSLRGRRVATGTASGLSSLLGETRGNERATFEQVLDSG
jgi:hypothetical protein